LSWLESTLSFALKSNSPAVNTALPLLYQTISECYKSSGEFEKAEEYLLIQRLIDIALLIMDLSIMAQKRIYQLAIS
jgi:hypothetical protein